MKLKDLLIPISENKLIESSSSSSVYKPTSLKSLIGKGIVATTVDDVDYGYDIPYTEKGDDIVLSFDGKNYALAVTVYDNSRRKPIKNTPSLIVQDGDKIIGATWSVVVKYDTEVAYRLEYVHVDRKYRGTGVGKLLAEKEVAAIIKAMPIGNRVLTISTMSTTDDGTNFIGLIKKKCEEKYPDIKIKIKVKM
jgi:hypothetical protein